MDFMICLLLIDEIYLLTPWGGSVSFSAINNKIKEHI